MGHSQVRRTSSLRHPPITSGTQMRPDACPTSVPTTSVYLFFNQLKKGLVVFFLALPILLYKAVKIKCYNVGGNNFGKFVRGNWYISSLHLRMLYQWEVISCSRSCRQLGVQVQIPWRPGSVQLQGLINIPWVLVLLISSLYTQLSMVLSKRNYSSVPATSSFQISSSHSMAPGPAASAPPENLLEMQIPGPHPRHSDSETVEAGPDNL